VSNLGKYLHQFSQLRRDHAKGWPSSTLEKSPYKPLLLLSVLDQLEAGTITANLVELTPELGDLFSTYCSIVLGGSELYNIAMPFYSLKNDGFWHLIPIPGREPHAASGRRLISVGQLIDNVLGAQFDEELFLLLTNKQDRDVLRAALIDAYFDIATQAILWERVATNQAAFLYSNDLLEQARKKLKELRPEFEADRFTPQARDQGFRRAVVVAYNHRCACCGLRIVTPGGHTAVEAAHIIPWSETRNDHPTNGMALCRLCHWSFDEGLMSVDMEYRVILSPQLATHGNMPGLLQMLDTRPIFLPQETVLHPDPDNLHWRYKNIFRRV